ncbi:MAG: hypothetical protein WD872_20100 [Pirellulaceae bacterium]
MNTLLVNADATDAAPDRVRLRLLLAVCQATAILVTWPLWQARRGAAGPPNLPLLDLALLNRWQPNLGEALLITLVLVVLWPRIGAIAHGLVLLVAICLDQLRIQPEFVSVAILLAGTLPRRGWLLVARCHLISLWCFAGLHKLLSAAYLHETGPDLARGLFAGLNERQAFTMGVGMALSELSLGAISIHPRTRRLVPALAVLLHGGILLSLVAQQWNQAVWPWNLALAAAGFCLFRNWHEPLWAWPAPAQPAKRTWLWNGVATVVLFYPALFYLNLCDGYLAWCVYSSNLPEAHLHPGLAVGGRTPSEESLAGGGESLFYRSYTPLSVPFSPAVRLFEQYAGRVGRPGDVLVIDDPRPWSRWRGRGRRVLVVGESGALTEVRPTKTR